MQYTQSEDTYIIKLEQGEELIATLTNFCNERSIATGFFCGIGAVKGLSCGYYALDEKKYYFTQYDDLVEVVSLSGNVSLKEGKSFVHVHGVFTNTQNQAFGGHIENMTSGIVVEVILTVIKAEVKREYDAEIGLFLWNCRD